MRNVNVVGVYPHESEMWYTDCYVNLHSCSRANVCVCVCVAYFPSREGREGNTVEFKTNLYVYDDSIDCKDRCVRGWCQVIVESDVCIQV